jgi:excisionase family DNA binding protein
MTQGRYLTTAEAAVRAGVTAKTISRWVDAGVLYAVFTTGGHRRIELSHLDAFLETRRSLFATSPDHHAVVVVASGRGACVQALQSVIDRRRLGSRWSRCEARRGAKGRCACGAGEQVSH